MLNKIIAVCVFLISNCFAVYPDSFYDDNICGCNNLSNAEKVEEVKNSKTDSTETIRKNPFKDKLSIFVKWGIKLDDFHKYQIRHSNYFGIQFNSILGSSWGVQHELDYWKADYKHNNISGEVTSLSYILSLYFNLSGDKFFTRASIGFGFHRMNFMTTQYDEIEDMTSLNFGFNIGYKLSNRISVVSFIKQQISGYLTLAGYSPYRMTPTFIGLGFGYRF